MPPKQDKVKKPAGPKTADLIKEAIVSLKERTGSSGQAIKSWILKNKGVEVQQHVLRAALKRGVEKGELRKIKSSYRVAPKEASKTKSAATKSKKSAAAPALASPLQPKASKTKSAATKSKKSAAAAAAPAAKPKASKSKSPATKSKKPAAAPAPAPAPEAKKPRKSPAKRPAAAAKKPRKSPASKKPAATKAKAPAKPKAKK